MMGLLKASIAIAALFLGYRVGLDGARKYVTPSGA